MIVNEQNQQGRQLFVADDMEWNVLQVAIDDIIPHLEDVLIDEELDQREVIEERLIAARALKEKLAGPTT